MKEGRKEGRKEVGKDYMKKGLYEEMNI